MAWTLRPAAEPEIDELLPLVAAYHDFEHIELDGQTRRDAVLRLLREPALGGIWFVMHDNVIAGYIALCIGFSIEFGGHDSFVDEFYLRPQFRGQGGGRRALQLLVDIARKRNVRAVHLEVARDNQPARRLYETVGMQAREKYVLMSIDL